MHPWFLSYWGGKLVNRERKSLWHETEWMKDFTVSLVPPSSPQPLDLFRWFVWWGSSQWLPVASKPKWSCTQMWGSQDVLPLLPSLPQSAVRHGLCCSLLLSTSSFCITQLSSYSWKSCFVLPGPGVQQSGHGRQALIPAMCFFS